jgi:hypothetical protein
MRFLLWMVLSFQAGGGMQGGMEATDRLVPPGYKGNPWGPAATAARKAGQLPPIPDTPLMTQWDRWGRQVLKDGDIVFRRGDARILGGWFPFSRFLANVSGSRFSHTGTVVFEDGEPIVYDTTKLGVRRQPFKIWILDNVGAFGVKRLKAAYRDRVPKVVEYLHDTYQKQVPFDYELSLDDRSLYCVEMAEKAFRHAGLALSEPVLLADMENINQFPICVLGFTTLTSLKLDQAVFFPGNERHGIWSSPSLETVYETPRTPSQTARPNPAARPREAVAGRPAAAPRN